MAFGWARRYTERSLIVARCVLLVAPALVPSRGDCGRQARQAAGGQADRLPAGKRHLWD